MSIRCCTLARHHRERPPGLNRFRQTTLLRNPPTVNTTLPADDEFSGGSNDDIELDFASMHELVRTTGYSEDRIRSLLTSDSIPASRVVCQSLLCVEEEKENPTEDRLQSKLQEVLYDIAEARHIHQQEAELAEAAKNRVRQAAVEKAQRATKERITRSAAAPLPLSLTRKDQHVLKFESEMRARSEARHAKEEAKKAASKAAAQEKRERGLLSNLAIRRRTRDAKNTECTDGTDPRRRLTMPAHDNIIGYLETFLPDLIARGLPPTPRRRNSDM